MAQISWANDNIEKLQEDIVTFEDMKVNKLCPINFMSMHNASPDS